MDDVRDGSPTVFVTDRTSSSLAFPPRPPRRRGLWLLPLLLALALVAGVLVALRQGEQTERLDQREALITDALSVRQQIEQRVDAERQRLKSLAQRIDIQPPTAAVFGSLPEVYEGLQRSWISVTWLDANNRVVAQLPEGPVASRNTASSGLSAHLAQPLANGGSLVVRYSPGVMLRQNVPWWIAHKYDVRLVDTAGAVIASTFEGSIPEDRQSYSLSLVDAMGSDANLELIARDRQAAVPRLAGRLDRELRRVDRPFHRHVAAADARSAARRRSLARRSRVAQGNGRFAERGIAREGSRRKTRVRESHAG